MVTGKLDLGFTLFNCKYSIYNIPDKNRNSSLSKLYSPSNRSVLKGVPVDLKLNFDYPRIPLFTKIGNQSFFSERDFYLQSNGNNSVEIQLL